MALNTIKVVYKYDCSEWPQAREPEGMVIEVMKSGWEADYAVVYSPTLCLNVTKSRCTPVIQETENEFGEVSP